MGKQMEQWIETATAQLRCRRAVPGVAQELESHLQEQYHTFLKQGFVPEDAERKTVESMGDPVLAGGALDHAHRPRPAWGPFGAAALLLLLGGILRWWQSAPLSNGLRLWREGTWQTLFVAEISVFVLAVFYFCIDISLLIRRAWLLYGGLVLISGLGICFGVMINGRYFWQIPLAGLYSALDFALLFVPVYTAVVYTQRGRGWRGFAVSALALLPGILLCLHAPHLLAALLICIAGLVVGVLCCCGNWFGVGKRRGLLALLGAALGAAGIPIALLMRSLLRYYGADWFRYLLSRSSPCFFALEQPYGVDGRGYWQTGLYRMWEGMQWFGSGDNFLWLTGDSGIPTVKTFVERGSAELLSDYLPAYLGWIYGAFWALLLIAAVIVAVVWLWRTALRIRSAIGRMCAVGICTSLTFCGIIYLINCFGWCTFTKGLLPFFGGNVDTIVQAAVIGLLLSAFRFDNVICEPSAVSGIISDPVSLKNSFLRR